MSRFVEFVRRSFAEFLGIPTMVIGGFLLLTVFMYWLDRTEVPILGGFKSAMSRLVFTTPDSTRSLLGTLATSVITLTSITFSILLVAVQQAAASMTHSIVDQFLRRASNQVFFGFFVGLALYALIILSATSPSFNPVLSGSVALLLGMVALFLLIVLIYSTIHQVRPAVVVEAIHDHTVDAHERHRRLLRRTRRTPTAAGEAESVAANLDGFVVGIDFDALAAALPDQSGAEAEVAAPIGSFVAVGEPLARVRGAVLDAEARRRIHGAFVLDRVRDLANDPAFGIEEMANIAWTSISSSKQNPAPGRLVILALRDLLARWSSPSDDETDAADQEVLPVVYDADMIGEVLDALELMAVVCSEAMQTQNATEVIDALVLAHPRLPAGAQQRVADLSMRMLSALGDHVLTAPLDEALQRLAGTLAVTHPVEARAIRRARDTLAQSIGSLNSRSTRVPTA